MPENFTDRLQTAIRGKKAPVCVGIDPSYASLPAEITEHKALNDETDSEAALDAVLEFCRRVIRIVAPLVPAVKINSAFFERYYWEGIEAYFEIIQEASEAKLMVVGDCKRGDIGSTAEMYARSALGDPDFGNLDDMVGPDAITCSPYFGMDGLGPFLEVAREEQKGLFALVRTSNPSADVIQSAKLEDGSTVAEHIARQIAEWGSDPKFVGRAGYSLLGAVVAPKSPEETARLRELMPKSLFLVPGYGAQGATAEDVAPCFKSDGSGALVCASRSIIYAYNDMQYIERFPSEWEKCIEQACRDTIKDINRVVQNLGG